MTLLAPGALWWLLLAVPVAGLYLFRRRVIERVVPSLLFWEPDPRQRLFGGFGRRLRRFLSLLLALLVVAALVLAMTEPSFSPRRDELLIVLDDSATMQTVEDDGRTRFEIAAEMALARIREAASGTRVSIILGAVPPALLLSRESNVEQAATVLRAARPRDVRPRLDDAVALANRLRQSSSSAVLVLTDSSAEARPAAQVNEWIKVGREQPDAGIAAVALRAEGDGLDVYVTQVGLTGREATIRLLANGQELARAAAPLREATNIIGLSPKLTPGAPFEVRIEPADRFALNNTWFGVWPSTSMAKVRLVSSGNPFLQGALDQPFLTVNLVSESSPTPAESADVTVFDAPRESGARPVAGRFLIFGGQDPFALAPPSTAEANLTATQWRPDEPVLRDVDWANWPIARSAGLTPPSDARILVRAGQTPLIWTVRRAGPAGGTGGDFLAVYVNFAVNESNGVGGANSASFLNLALNAVDFLLDRRPDDAALAHETGAPLSFPARRAANVIVVGPAENPIQPYYEEARFVVPYPERAGFYTLQSPGGALVRAANYSATVRVSSPGSAASQNSRPENPAARPFATLPLWGRCAAAAACLLTLEMLLFCLGVLYLD